MPIRAGIGYFFIGEIALVKKTDLFQTALGTAFFGEMPIWQELAKS
jgi:hypothetical protein